MMNWMYLILAGLASGVVGGMGMGGGTLLIPILTLFLSYSQKQAQAINLFAFIPMAIVSLVIHIKNKLVDFGVGIPVVIAGMVFCIGGALLANNLSNDILRKVFGGFLLVVGVYQMIQTIINLIKRKNKNVTNNFRFRIFIK